ncbi:MAG: hypothetical protein PHQ32_07680 [Firmicutes bacterium]|nr:hypothetical protein [Bacillota bacterium]
MEENRKRIKKKNDSKIEGKGEYKPKKSKVSFFFRLFGFILVALFIYFAVKSTSGDSSYSVFERLDNLKQDKLPYLVVIRDDFSQVTNDNKNDLNNIVKDANDSMMVFNITYRQDANSKESEYFIDKYNIESLPVVILCDGNGDLIKCFYVPYDTVGINSYVKSAAESSVE